MTSLIDTSALAIASESDDSSKMTTTMPPCSVGERYSCPCPAVDGQTMIYQTTWMHTWQEHQSEFIICAPLSSSGSAADYADSLFGDAADAWRDDDFKDPESEPEPEEVQQTVVTADVDAAPSVMAQWGWQHYTRWGWVRPLVNEPSPMDIAVYEWLADLFRRERFEAVQWPWKEGDNQWWVGVDVCPSTIALDDLPLQVP